MSETPRPPIAAAGNRPIILVVDDTEDIRDLVTSVLQDTYTIRPAFDGRSALKLALQKPAPNLILLDVDMPGLGGLQVIKRMQQLTAAPPAILLARQLSAQLLHEALGMKVFSVLGKPVDFNLLLDALARVMRRHYEGRWPM